MLHEFKPPRCNTSATHISDYDRSFCISRHRYLVTTQLQLARFRWLLHANVTSAFVLATCTDCITYSPSPTLCQYHRRLVLATCTIVVAAPRHNVTAAFVFASCGGVMHSADRRYDRSFHIAKLRSLVALLNLCIGPQLVYLFTMLIGPQLAYVNAALIACPTSHVNATAASIFQSCTVLLPARSLCRYDRSFHICNLLHDGRLYSIWYINYWGMSTSQLSLYSYFPIALSGCSLHNVCTLLNSPYLHVIISTPIYGLIFTHHQFLLITMICFNILDLILLQINVHPLLALLQDLLYKGLSAMHPTHLVLVGNKP